MTSSKKIIDLKSGQIAVIVGDKIYPFRTSNGCGTVGNIAKQDEQDLPFQMYPAMSFTQYYHLKRSK